MKWASTGAVASSRQCRRNMEKVREDIVTRRSVGPRARVASTSRAHASRPMVEFESLVVGARRGRTARTNPQLATGPQKCVVFGPVGLLMNARSDMSRRRREGRRALPQEMIIFFFFFVSSLVDAATDGRARWRREGRVENRTDARLRDGATRATSSSVRLEDASSSRCARATRVFFAQMQK